LFPTSRRIRLNTFGTFGFARRHTAEVALLRTETPSIAGTGLFALDVIVRLDGSKAAPSLGGSAGNVLSILGALGWGAAPVGVLGDDFAGHTIRRDFEHVGADMRLLRRSLARCTPVIFQHQLDRQAAEDEATHRFAFACPDCGGRRRPHWDDDPEFLDVRADLPAASVFYLDRPTRLGVAVAEQYASHGAVVVFEPSAVGDDENLFVRAARAAHIVKYSDERLGDLGAYNLRPDGIEIQTRGSHGLRFRSGTGGRSWTYLPAFRLPFIHDTAGAGDWCTAGMLYELFGAAADARTIDCEAIQHALAFGQVLSTLNCMTEGARGLLATWSPDQIVRSARAVAEARRGMGMGQYVDQTFRDFAHDVEQTSWATALRGAEFGCCSTL
jgi:sugar/nucleoside kinase (ribokinase family)